MQKKKKKSRWAQMFFHSTIWMYYELSPDWWDKTQQVKDTYISAEMAMLRLLKNLTKNRANVKHFAIQIQASLGPSMEQSPPMGDSSSSSSFGYSF